MAKRRKAKQGYRSPGTRSGGSMGSSNMMAQIQQMQEQMAATQEQLAEETLEIGVGGGAVTVTVNGNQEILALTIDPDVVDPDDVEMLQDLVLAAVNQALEQSRDMASQRMGNLTAGLDLPPGLL